MKKQKVFCGIIIVPFMMGILMERGQFQKSSNLVFIGPPYSKTHINMFSNAIAVKG